MAIPAIKGYAVIIVAVLILCTLRGVDSVNERDAVILFFAVKDFMNAVPDVIMFVIIDHAVETRIINN